MLIKVEQVEQIPDGRHVPRNVRIVVVNPRIGQIVTATAAERGMEHPVPFDELYERRMLVIGMADMATSRKGRNGDHRNAWTCTEEINRLDEARVIVAATFIHSDKDRGFGPLFRVALRQFNDVLSEGLEQSPFRGSGMAVHQAVWLHIGNCGKSAFGQIGEEIGDVPHVICHHVGIISFILERVADIAVAPVKWADSYRGDKTDTIIFPGNIAGTQYVANATLRGLRNHETGLHCSFRSEGW